MTTIKSKTGIGNNPIYTNMIYIYHGENKST